MTLHQFVKRQLQLINVDGAQPLTQILMVDNDGEEKPLDFVSYEGGCILLYCQNEADFDGEGPVPQPEPALLVLDDAPAMPLVNPAVPEQPRLE